MKKPRRRAKTATMLTGRYRHVQLGAEIGALVDRKDAAYGQAVTVVPAILALLYPQGVKPEQYRDMALLVRMLDKQCRIARGDKRAFNESPWADLAGYALRGLEINQRTKGEK